MENEMAKKKYDAPEVTTLPEGSQLPPLATAADLPNGTAPSNGESKSPIQAKPMIYLQNGEVQYQFTRFAMPKRAGKQPEGEFQVLIDGVEHPAWTTASRGWAADDATIEYIWLNLGDAAGYITLDYGVKAADYANAEFTRGEGKANRDNPVRVPKDAEKEANRKALAAATLAAKKPAEAAPE